MAEKEPMLVRIAQEDNVSLRDFLVGLMNEREAKYNAAFKAQETAVNAALAAQKELTNSSATAATTLTTAAFAASEKAITKAEAAQTAYNERSNEFRGQLDDQAKRLVPRVEMDSRFTSTEEKIDDIKKNVASLLETRAGLKAVVDTNKDTKTSNQSTILVYVAIISAVVSAAMTWITSPHQKDITIPPPAVVTTK